ncbi:MAG: CinA family protein [Ruminococcaceae bacterium]|nr:CinA family protein [Oscillospiraceae bacterium]
MLNKQNENYLYAAACECVQLLMQKQCRISMAESCTGGLLASSIVSVADASKVFDASFVTYANDAKIKYLGVSEKNIEQYGVVSEAVAGEMAIGCAKANGAEVGVGISGIAGPSGGSAEKPVGTVAFGFCINGIVTTRLMHFPDTGRQGIREAATLFALQQVCKMLKN